MLDHLNEFHQVEAKEQVIKKLKRFLWTEKKKRAEKLCILFEVTWIWKIKITYS